MSIGVNLESFRGFALVRQIMGREGSVIRAEESGSLAGRKVKLSLRGLDLPAFAATKGGFGFWALRKLGLMDMTDVDIDLRPSIDPVSKRIRLDVTGLSGTGSVGGVRVSLARKLLSKVLPLVFGDIGGVGFVSGDSILSVTFDAGRLLGKVIPDHGNMIPGGIPAISEVSADENGFNVAVRL